MVPSKSSKSAEAQNQDRSQTPNPVALPSTLTVK